MDCLIYRLYNYINELLTKTKSSLLCLLHLVSGIKVSEINYTRIDLYIVFSYIMNCVKTTKLNINTTETQNHLI